MGCNKLISADENFRNTKVITLPTIDNKSYLGYSSFKFIPGTNDSVIVALLTKELGEETATYITAFTVNGKTIFGPDKINTNYKYEGIEFF